eukprot:jgi/Picsp_1/2419/NSC_05880-R1_---NA---
MDDLSAGRKSPPRSNGTVGWTTSSEKVRAESLPQTDQWIAMGGQLVPMSSIFLPSRTVEPSLGSYHRRHRNLLPLSDSGKRSHEENLGIDGVARQEKDRLERKRKRRNENLEILKEVYGQLKNLELKILRIMEHEETEELEDLKEQEGLAKAKSQATGNETTHHLYERHEGEKTLQSAV